MPTLGWIQESALDRLLEQGSDDSTRVNPEYPCRVCGKVFNTISARNKHEINHPVLNPAIFIKGKEVCSDQLLITTPLTNADVVMKNVDFITINEVNCSSSTDILDKISGSSRAFLDVQYGNNNIRRNLKITINIADAEELRCVDEAFIHYFVTMDINDSSILGFTKKVQELYSVKNYGDGVVRYIQGLIAKDNRSGSIKFEDFIKRFNQATFSLRSYETRLAHAIRAVVDFNRNSFSEVFSSGIVLLDSALDFFKGGEIKHIDNQQEVKAFPVDFSTDCILSTLMSVYKDGTLMDLEEEIKNFTPRYLSLQDKSKFNYICYRKGVQVGDNQAVNKYFKSLRFDDAFSEIIEKLYE